MSIEAIGAVVAIIVSIASFITAVVRGRDERRKLKAEATEIIGNAWQDLCGKLEARIKQLEGEVAQRVKESEARDKRIGELQDCIDEQERKIVQLTDELHSKTNELIAARARITELETDVAKLHSQLEQVKKKTGPLGNGE